MNQLKIDLKRGFGILTGFYGALLNVACSPALGPSTSPSIESLKSESYKASNSDSSLTATVSTLAGTAGVTGSYNGIGGHASFSAPGGLAIDAQGNLYIADWGNSSVRVVTANGFVSNLAGTAGDQGNADGQGPTATLTGPIATARDTNGNVYVSDNLSNVIRKISPDGTVSTLAGTPNVTGTNDGSGPTASFNSPSGLAVDTSGNVYVADYGNHVIRKITPSGLVTTLAGQAGVPGSADGNGASATLQGPSAITMDNLGTLYVAEAGGDIVRKIMPNGDVTTIAGAPGIEDHRDGVGSSARFNSPWGITVDSSGTLYVADTGNNVIRKITQTGEVTTLAGTPGTAGSADGVGSKASFSRPSTIVAGDSGTLFVTDSNNHTIRKILFSTH